MSADNNETPETKQDGQSADQLASFKSELDNRLSEVQAQLAQINQQFMAASQSRVSAAEDVSDDDIFEPKKLEQKITSKATAIAADMIREEQRKTAVIYDLGKEFPEIHTDVQLQTAIREAQKSLPESMRDSAVGYETAVLKAVAKQGILPKSKRPDNSTDDFSVSGSRSIGNQSKGGKKGKASEGTRAVAELLRGRALTKEEEARLDEASTRSNYSRYR
jgi:hypothetical protein